MALHHRHVLCLLLTVLVFVQFTEAHKKHLPLPPLFARNIGDFAGEPSGLTYCRSTDRLYMNCDKHSCHYIYELDVHGNPVRTLEFDSSMHDIEAIACNDVDGYLYIAQEGKRRVQAFYLDDYNSHHGQKQLKEAYHFYVVTGDSTSSRSGLEGMTVNTRTKDIYLANEKSPAMIVRCHENGKEYQQLEIDYARDISGLAYDDQLDALWVLSDQNEQVFLTDLTGEIVYDYWDLPVTNPEGIAINNHANPPIMYIATDPSAPSGPQYVPLILAFEKPTNGTGYKNWDGKHYPKYVTNPPPCKGCYEVYGQAVENGFKNAEYWQTHFPRAGDDDSTNHVRTILLAVLLPVGGLFVVAVLFVVLVLAIRWRRNRRSHISVSLEDADEIVNTELESGESPLLTPGLD